MTAAAWLGLALVGFGLGFAIGVRLYVLWRRAQRAAAVLDELIAANRATLTREAESRARSRRA